MSLASAALAIVLAAAPGFPMTFDQIVGGVGNRPRPSSCALMQRWIDQNPSHAEVPRGLMWMARLHAMDDQPELGRPLLERVLAQYKGTEWELRATKELADLDIREHRYGPAIASYEKLAASSSELWREMGALSLAQARGERSRYYLFELLAAALMALAISRFVLAARAGSRPWRPPTEVIVAAPVALLLMIGALAQPAASARAILWLAIGGTALIWATGAHLRGAKLTTGRRVTESVLGLAQTAALLYCVVVANGLWDSFVQTLLLGSE